MIKRFLLALALVVALCAPASAEVKGVYGGLKFIDSIFSTGSMSRSGYVASETSSYSQNTIGGGIFVGYDFFPQNQVPVRAEIEYAIRTNANTSWDKSYVALGHTLKGELEGQWNLQTLFLNAYWDFHNSTAFTPYIGAGIGMGFINSRYNLSASLDGYNFYDHSTTNTQTVFAWNVGVGCSYAFTENLSADLAYRFVGLGYTETEKTVGITDGTNSISEKQKIGFAPYANEFSLGLRFTF
ncbi:MAG: outer membrane beta-barrel protein [Desulfovibrio sp.]|jgi:opacity protein-like surface antigen|nr:outer membrane beta-barrel protein [Desulfovibrio sp.]